ncbi:MAG: hypothetical protein NC355_01375 [Blautia sp.]|nr:hypothetical protein [Blautia sp.]
MKKGTKRTLLSFMLVLTFMVQMLSSGITVKANDMRTATEIALGERISGESNSALWYKISIPKDIRDQTIQIVFMPKGSGCYLGLYNYNGINMADPRYYVGYCNGGTSDYVNVKIASEEVQGSYTFVKGHDYYIKLARYASGDEGYINFDLNVTGDYKKASRLSVIARKGNNYVSVSTIEGAKVTISVNDEIIRSGSKTVSKITKKAENGKVKVKLSRKLKKGDKVVITVKKSGYETKKTTKKIGS